MSRFFLGRLASSDFKRNSLTLSGGVAVAQVIPLLFYPLLSRIFTVSEFGLLAALTSIITVLSVVGSGRYENGILVAPDKQEAAHVAVLSVVLSLVTMTLSWLVMRYLLMDHLVAWLHEPQLSRWLFVCPLASVCIIVFNVYNEWCVREKYFHALAVNKMVNAGATTLSKVFLGFVHLVSQGLVIGDLLGRFISAVGCVIRAWVKDGSTFSKVRMNGLRHCLVKYKDFPLYTMPGQLFNAVGQSAPVLLLALFFDSATVGLYSMATMVFVLPITIIGNTLRDVYRQRANEEYVATGQCVVSFRKLLLFLVALGGSGLMLLVWFLPWLMSLVLGPQWREAGHYAQILAPTMVLSFIAGPLSGVFIITNKLRAFVVWQLLYMLLSIVPICLGAVCFHSIVPAITCHAVGMAVVYLTSIVMTYRFAKGDKKIQV